MARLKLTEWASCCWFSSMSLLMVLVLLFGMWVLLMPLGHEPKADVSSTSQESVIHKPNLLFIVTDQQRFDTLGIVQNELPGYSTKLKIRTPHLDALAERGVLFETAYCASPTCAASRASLQLGTTLQRHGINKNHLVGKKFYQRMKFIEEKVKAQESFEQVLVDKHGYVAEYYGKWHRPDLLYYSHKSGKRVIAYNHYDFEKNSPSFTPINTHGRTYKNALNVLEKQGKLNVSFTSGQQESLVSGFPYTPIGMDSFQGRNERIPKHKSNSGVYGRDSLSKMYTDSAITAQEALKSLSRLQKFAKPFSLSVHFTAPHPPTLATGEYLDYYYKKRKNLFISPSINDGLKNSAYKVTRDAPKYRNPELIAQFTAVYYAMIEEVDYWVGTILKSVNLNNTLVVFTSDHGEMLGSHGMTQKFRFYEEATRVPLIMSLPGQIPAKTRVKAPVSHIDVFSTVLDYLGASAFDHSDGKSLRRLIEHTTYNSNENIAVVEIDDRIPEAANKFSRKLGSIPNFMIRKGDFKLMLPRESDSKVVDMMFDLEKDPYEENNLLGQRGMLITPQEIGKAEHLKVLLLEWMMRNDGWKGYYSNPMYNLFIGNGDMREIHNRRTWRLVPYWQSDTQLFFGSPVLKEGKYIRNEYLYIGRTQLGVLSLRDIVVKEGNSNSTAPAKYFKVDKSAATIPQHEYIRIKVSFSSSTKVNIDSLNATIQFKTNVVGEEHRLVKIVEK